MSDAMSVPEAAARFGVSERTIWRWLRSGRLTAERTGERALVSMPVAQAAHTIAEARVAYASSENPWRIDLQPGPWPYTPENIAKRKAILAAQRRRAADEIDALGRETRPDLEGLTGVDYIRELRGPIGDDPEIDASWPRDGASDR